MFTVEDLHVDLPAADGWSRVVRGVDLAVSAGETLAIVGESGSGKSLTALSILNLLPRGARRRAQRLSFDGEDLLSLSERQMEDVRGRRIGVIFQDPTASFNPSLTIGQQLEEVHQRHCRKGRQAARDRAVDLLEQVGVPAPAMRLRQYPLELSGGLRQRAMIAMALMCEPSMVIADEPTTALDVTVQAQVLKVLRDLQRRTNIALILITHDFGVVAAVADRLAVMYAGEIVEKGDADAILAQPRHPYTRGLFSCIPRLGEGGAGRRLPVIRGRIPSRLQMPVGCVFGDRCDQVVDECRKSAIALAALTPAHASRCIRTDQLQARFNG